MGVVTTRMPSDDHAASPASIAGRRVLDPESTVSGRSPFSSSTDPSTRFTSNDAFGNVRFGPSGVGVDPPDVPREEAGFVAFHVVRIVSVPAGVNETCAA